MMFQKDLVLKKMNRAVPFAGVALIGGVLFLDLGLLNEAHAQGDGAGGGFDTELIKEVTCELFRLMSGELGGLLTAVAGIGAIVAAAFGAYRSAYSLVVVGVASFILQAMVSLYFGSEVTECGGSGGSSARTINTSVGAELATSVRSVFTQSQQTAFGDPAPTDAQRVVEQFGPLGPAGAELPNLPVDFGQEGLLPPGAPADAEAIPDPVSDNDPFFG